MAAGTTAVAALVMLSGGARLSAQATPAPGPIVELEITQPSHPQSGRGRILMFATNPCFRAETLGEFYMLLNAVLHFNDARE